MQYYAFLKKLITTVVILYFLVGNFTWALSRVEIYPIASWNLFSIIPNLVTDYGLQINAINHQELDSPTYFQYLPNKFEEADSVIVFYVIQNLGNAIESNDTQAIEELRKQIESHYLSSQIHVEYEIQKRSYYAIKRWQTRDYEEIKRLSTYETSNP